MVSAESQVLAKFNNRETFTVEPLYFVVAQYVEFVGTSHPRIYILRELIN